MNSYKGPKTEVTKEEARDAVAYLENRMSMPDYARKYGIAQRANTRHRVTVVMRRAVDAGWVSLDASGLKKIGIRGKAPESPLLKP